MIDIAADICSFNNKQGNPVVPQTKDLWMGFVGTYGPNEVVIGPGDVISISMNPCESVQYSTGIA